MIIFDLDGTLWETVDTTYEAANIVVSKMCHIDNLSDLGKEDIRIKFEKGER